jgi:high-affinity K+ transport system ATPase subunit B
VKFYKRLLLTIPFIIVTIWYCRFNDPDEKCEGLANLMIKGFFIFLLLVTIIIALIGIFHRQRLQKTKFEPISLSITILTFLILIFCTFSSGHTKGQKWIEAENKEAVKQVSKQNLTLRKNGNFTIDLIEIEFGCSISGTFKKNKDTIILDKETVDKTNRRITTTYLIKSNEIVPLYDTVNKITFRIKDIK